ncbi:MAG: dihydrofolate reductase family protein [Gemmobacter sp.]|jgi:dihydrofolate reductase
MITGHIFIATSVDGFIARENGDIGWLLERDDPAEDHGYDTFIADKDVIVMGRGSFDSVRHITPWPYDRPVLVLSSTLSESDLPPELAGKVRISPKTPVDAMAMLQAEGRRRAYVDGGQVVQAFLRAGLIADMVVTQVPVLLGAGRRLFGTIPSDIPLVHQATRCFPSGLVQSHYRVGP